MSRGAAAREALTVLTGASTVVKAASIMLAVVYLTSWDPSGTAMRVLSVRPGYFWPPHFWLWTAATHCFFEIHFWEVIIDVVTIVMVGKLLEPLWGAIEMLVFFAVVNIGVAILSAFFYYILYMVTFNTELLFDVHIHGLAGYLAGVTVAIKQVMPDHVLYRSPLGKITNRHMSLIAFGLTFLLWALGLVHGSYCTMFGSGLLISWIYLRFYQIHANGTRGDLADNFAFHTFFPNVIQPPIALLCNAIFTIMVNLRICRRPVRKYDIGSSASSISISLPGVESHDTERRRQIALKALSERLNKSDLKAGTASGAGTSEWPSLEEDEQKKPLLESVHIPIETTGQPAGQPDIGEPKDSQPAGEGSA